MQQKDDEEPIGDEPRSEVRLFNWRFIMIHWSFMKFQWRFGSTSLLSMFRQACDRGSAHWPGQGFTALPLYCHWVNSSSLLLPSGTRWVEHGQEEETGQGQAAQESMTWHFDGMLFVSSQWDKACALMPWSRKRRSSRKIKRRKSRKMKRRQRRQHSGATYVINASIKVVYYTYTCRVIYDIRSEQDSLCRSAKTGCSKRNLRSTRNRTMRGSGSRDRSGAKSYSCAWCRHSKQSQDQEKEGSIYIATKCWCVCECVFSMKSCLLQPFPFIAVFPNHPSLKWKWLLTLFW